MTDFEAAVEWLVSSGRVASKGAARHRLIEEGQKRLEAEKAIERGEGPEWVQRMAVQLAGARPAGLDLIAPGADAAAKRGVDLANRAIGFAGQNAGAAYAAGILAAKRPWWKRIFRA